MGICGGRNALHERVIFQGKSCPVCEVLLTSTEANNEVKKLRKRVGELKEAIEILQTRTRNMWMLS